MTERPPTERSRLNFPKVDAATQEAKLSYWTNVLQQLDGITASSLSPAEQINYAVYRAQIQGLVNSQKFREYEMPFNSDSAFWSGITYTPRQPFHTLADYNNYISQLKDIPRYFNEEIVNMRAGLEARLHASAGDARRARFSIAVHRQGQDSRRHRLLRAIQEDAGQHSRSRAGEAAAEGAKAIRDKVMPAYAELLKFVRNEYIPERAQDAGGRRPAGRQGVLPVEDPRLHHD